MSAPFTPTMNAFEKGLESIKPAAAIKLIDGWHAAVSELDVSGSKGIANDLEALKKALDSDEPDGDRVRTLVNKLGEAVGKIAPRSPDEKATPKLEELGKALAAA